MTPTDTEPFWRRWMRWLATFETAMEMTYDDFQDRRIDRIETEMARLRSDVDALSGPAAQPRRSLDGVMSHRVACGETRPVSPP